MTAPVFFDFAEFGEPGVWPVDPELIKAYLRAAEYMVENYSTPALGLACEQITQDLWNQSQESLSPTDEWIGNAILVTAIRGILGIQTPPIIQ